MNVMLGEPPVDQKSQELKRLETQMEITSATIKSINSLTQRYSKIKDPLVRHGRMVDKFIVIVDIVGNMALSGIKKMNDDIKEHGGNKADVVDEAHTTFNRLIDELIALDEFIQELAYSPDHPFGNKVMKKSEDDFKAASSKPLDEPVVGKPRHDG